jgi:hypothetical protein
MTAPATSPFTVRPARPAGLPAGVAPGSVTVPTAPARHPTPAPAHPGPRAIARELSQHLQAHGHTRLYTATVPGRAVVSLPQLTVWVTATTLTWTCHGQLTRWPAHDPGGAAQHITQLTHPTPPSP